MRHVLAWLSALSLFIALCAPANAAPAHHRARHLNARAQVVVPQGAGGARFAVPGWSNGETERWLYNASSQWTNG